ncbi:MAG TPA: hypothetical protein VNS09_22585 [Solirubrobacter sp.]|nr:hypothetical protein [Solirubrobacter sp.]
MSEHAMDGAGERGPGEGGDMAGERRPGERVGAFGERGPEGVLGTFGERTPDEVLAAFGARLRAARVPRRRRWRRVLALVVVVIAAGGATATAGSALWASAPEVSAPGRPASAPRPDTASRPAYVARGRGWRLSASSCRFGERATVAVFLTVAHGGAGWRCDALAPAVAAGVTPPPVIFAPPRTRTHAFLFGAAPAGTVRVQALLIEHGAPHAVLRDVPARAAERPKATVYVARVPAGARLLTAVGLDARGRPTMRCDQETCR